MVPPSILRWYQKSPPDHRLVSETQSDEIYRIIEHNRTYRGYGAGELKYPCNGLVYCGKCGSICHSGTSARGKTPGTNHYYKCKKAVAKECSQKSIRMEKIEEAIIETLINRADMVTSMAIIPDRHDEPLEIKQLISQQQALKAIPNPDESIILALEELWRKISTYQYNRIKEQTKLQQSRELLLAVFSDRGYWLTLEDDDKKEIYRKLVERVVINDDGIESITLTDGWVWTPPPPLVAPPRLTGVTLRVGDKVRVIHRSGREEIGEIVRSEGIGTKRRLIVRVGTEEMVFSRELGRLMVDGRTQKDASHWILPVAPHGGES